MEKIHPVGIMLHLITILSFSTIISIIAYMIQHGEIESSKELAKFKEQTTVIDQKVTLTSASEHQKIIGVLIDRG